MYWSLEIEHAVLILARQWRELFRQQWLQINGTQVSHHVNSALCTASKLTMWLIHLSLPRKRTFPFRYLVHVNSRYAINHSIFLYGQFRFGILESYAIKRFMCFTGMKLSEVIYSCAKPLAKFDLVWGHL